MVGTDIRRRFLRWKAFVEMKRVEKRNAAAAEHVRVAETLRGEAKELAAVHERAARKSGQRSEAAPQAHSWPRQHSRRFEADASWGGRPLVQCLWMASLAAVA